MSDLNSTFHKLVSEDSLDFQVDLPRDPHPLHNRGSVGPGANPVWNGYLTTRGLLTHELDKSQIGQKCHRRLCMLRFCFLAIY